MDSHMNLHEWAFVENFVYSHRRDRFLAALANPKNREVFKRELYHLRGRSSCLDTSNKLFPRSQRPRFILSKLKGIGAQDCCWIFLNYIGGRDMHLQKALEAVVG